MSAITITVFNKLYTHVPGVPESKHISLKNNSTPTRRNPTRTTDWSTVHTLIDIFSFLTMPLTRYRLVLRPPFLCIQRDNPHLTPFTKLGLEHVNSMRWAIDEGSRRGGLKVGEVTQNLIGGQGQLTSKVPGRPHLADPLLSRAVLRHPPQLENRFQCRPVVDAASLALLLRAEMSFSDDRRLTYLYPAHNKSCFHLHAESTSLLTNIGREELASSHNKAPPVSGAVHLLETRTFRGVIRQATITLCTRATVGCLFNGCCFSLTPGPVTWDYVPGFHPGLSGAYPRSTQPELLTPARAAPTTQSHQQYRGGTTACSLLLSHTQAGGTDRPTRQPISAWYVHSPSQQGNLPQDAAAHQTQGPVLASQLGRMGHPGVVVRLLASQQGETGSIPCGVAPGFSFLGIVQDDAAIRRNFLGDLPFPPSLHSCAASY
ncbi:hypothetical protein PR048_000103 [Dryococelus australis]|uniref:Uncharacterized protein n=1 Tax=Dryococelus australis TaxID=614101 RepID=A0ABQ9IDV3_9NEOP|nr:hypothetical protein PR048_000103 [Dryococelus australis]